MQNWYMSVLVPSEDYINIDCGIASDTSYVDSLTGLTYVSDYQYIDTGSNNNVASKYAVDEDYTDLQTLRSFPINIKSCYTLTPVTEGLKYLVRATFYYGNYDKKGKPPKFDLYFGVNFWSTVDISTSDDFYPYEIIAIAPANYINVCLVNTGHGTPFISVLELRPVNNTPYQANSMQSLNMIYRTDIGSNYTHALRYPQDSLDRLWFSWTDASWTTLSTTSSIDGFDFEVPSLVLQTAAVPSSPRGSIDISWSTSDKSTTFFTVLHFSEIQFTSSSSLREFYLYANGESIFDIPIPLGYLLPSYAYITRTGYTDYNISLKSSARATLPPILNGFELYATVPVKWLPTDNGDGTFLVLYSIKKDWSGDPCVPTILCWTGVACSIDSSNISRITNLDLSSSGLSATIISAFGSLIALERLDLSGNSGLSRILPSGLQKKQNDGGLTVIFTKKSNGTGLKIALIIAAVVAMFLVVGAVALFFLYQKKKTNTRVSPPATSEDPRNIGIEISSNVLDNSKDSVVPEVATKDQIDIGGFGKVFKGHLENGDEVAVKVRSESSSQGIQQFLNEVEKLSRVHHKNLVSLIGYCKDGDQIALVYDYMKEGNLQDWIRGGVRSLPWKQRLRIVYESAQGLEYLHKKCNPSLIHRDVKTSNILLTTNLEAKVSDFGSVRDCSDTHVSTKVIGTPGYLDPNFSFGVVLLEIVTGKSPFLQGGQHLTQFVHQRLSKGKIESILDPNMGIQYNINSIWKVANLALRCTNEFANRPDMTEIVTVLKDSFNLEMSTMEMNSVASEEISQYSSYSRNEYTSGGEVHSRDFGMARVGNMQPSDYRPVAR
ncbi:Leucine-rich repeat protein kinase family protein [Rhynchospora pubera]|uniref:Leucine-rich repeat protein kinase family protein n=1 Tax=Rhynchospora pubera TaxID=906938 RepID=A0AAV8F376_9POAL|nr:Leucine-rich repeat protein kinase family protein [Rhynchospora pubera]